MAKIEKLNVVPVKKTSAGKKVVKAIVVIAAVNGAIKLISMYSSKKENSKNLPEGEYCYKLMMNGKQLSFNDQVVKKITLSAKMSGIDLDLSNIEDLDGLQIYCKGWMSGICIRVPENITVKTDLKIRAGGISNSVPSYIDENLPTIYISGKVYLSGVDIRLVEEQS
jgi:hypothetical protein